MAQSTILKARLCQKHDLEVNWQKATGFVPMQGELIVYDIEVDSDGNILELPEGRTKPYTYERFKIGDGITPVNDLPFTIEKVVEAILGAMSTQLMPKPTTINLYGSNWIEISDNMYSQDITEQLAGKISEYSKVDIQPTPEQLTIFHKKDVAFTTVNDDGNISVYAIGVKPEQDYENIQVTVTEVLIDG